ncbi:MAG: alpha/beta hydrolase [Pseudomonadota bacterium]
MTPMARTLLTGTLLALVATPILAQRQGGGRDRGDRPSRQCVREIVELCGSDRAAIPACLEQEAEALSDKCRKEVEKRIGKRREGRSEPQPFVAAIRPTRTVLFGSHQRQRVDVYEPKSAVEPLPLILFVHGGGWRTGDNKNVQGKPAFFNGQNYYFASTGYRLLPDHPVEEQAADIGAALQALVGQAGLIGFDPERVVIMGHSSGAHLAALVASDPQYSGEAFGSIRGAVLLDSAGYDVTQHMEDAPFAARRVYEDAFGFDPERQKALSPLTHVGGADAPHWLALYVEERTATQSQAQALVSALTKAGTAAKAVPISGTDHSRLNREIGTDAGAAQTQAIDAFLAEVFE